jgi:pimeloyl-ACP methyl ester carboxylesterase
MARDLSAPNGLMIDAGAIEAAPDNRRVVAFDQLGFGRTDPPLGNRYLNRLQRVPHAWSVLDALRLDRVVLVGHSEGAFMAARMALEQPNRVEKLVLVTSGGTSPRLGGNLDQAWMAAAQAAYVDPSGAETEDGFVRNDPHLRRAADPVYEGILRDNYRRCRKTGHYEMFRSLPVEEEDYILYPRLQEQHLLPRLGELKLPCLLLWSRDDPTVPVERGLKLMNLIQGADFHVFSDAGHMVMHDRPRVFNNMLWNWCAAE